MTHRTRRACLVAAALALLGVQEAGAGCLRQVYNRSGYVLMASRDGGPPVTVMPGRSVPLRLDRPGRLNVAAYCALPGAGARPVAEAEFDYEAVLDRCFIRFGSPILVPEFGRGMFGTQGTAPFTVNNPRQGDLILGPFEAGCPILDRRG